MVRNFSLREMKEQRPAFFKNASSAERYNVRKNHLIVTEVATGKITVWQFNLFGYGYRLIPVWHVAEGTALSYVIYKIEKLLRNGTLPLHPWGEYNDDAGQIQGMTDD